MPCLLLLGCDDPATVPHAIGWIPYLVLREFLLSLRGAGTMAAEPTFPETGARQSIRDRSQCQPPDIQVVQVTEYANASSRPEGRALTRGRDTPSAASECGPRRSLTGTDGSSCQARLRICCHCTRTRLSHTVDARASLVASLVRIERSSAASFRITARRPPYVTLLPCSTRCPIVQMPTALANAVGPQWYIYSYFSSTRRHIVLTMLLCVG